MGVATLFRDAEGGEYEPASVRLEREIILAADRLSTGSISEAAKKVIAMLKIHSTI